MGYEYDYSLLKPKPFSAYYTPISNEKTSILGTNGAPDQIYVGEGKYRRDIDPVMVGDGYVGGAGTEEQYRENALTERLKPNEKAAGTNPLKYWAIQGYLDNPSAKKAGGTVKGQWDDDDISWLDKKIYGINARNLQDAEHYNNFTKNEERWNNELKVAGVKDINGNPLKATIGHSDELNSTIITNFNRDKHAKRVDTRRFNQNVREARQALQIQDEASKTMGKQEQRYYDTQRLAEMTRLQEAAMREDQYNTNMEWEKEKYQQNILQQQAQQLELTRQHQENLDFKRDQWQEKTRQYNDNRMGNKVDLGISALATILGGLFA